MLQVENLAKSFGNVRAVDGVSFHIHRCEVVGLLGPNGAGKTTTMRIITGFTKPDHGSVFVNEIPALEKPEIARQEIGYLPENAPLYHDMEVIEFLKYIAALRNIALLQRSPYIKDVVELCGLSDVIGRMIGVLSRGYKQRVCLAQALLHKPKILILDEPTTGLDPHQIQEIRSLIKEIGKERTVILSTHIMQEVQAVCNRALIISKGKLVGEGTLEDLLKRKKGALRYFAKINAPQNQIESKVKDLSGFSIEPFQHCNGTWQTVVLQCEEANDRSEEIFQWVVDNHWSLKELRCETTSLEEVFLELTKE